MFNLAVVFIFFEGFSINALDCNIVGSKLKFQLRYYIHFWNYALEKVLNPLIDSTMG